jgi:DNA repair photolyase
MSKTTGTKEWSDKSVNILTGCTHACRYCYAGGMARRFKRSGDWPKSILRTKEVAKGRRRAKGVKGVMFPSSHDITPEFLEPCLTVLGKLLAAGNKVLVVSKPHLECIKRICADFDPTNLMFRFTIGAFDNAILKFWEPEAPSYEERLACLQYAFEKGFQTSVSMEPMLDTPNAVELFHRLAPFVTDKIWLGKLNRARNCIAEWRQIDAEIRQIEANQTDDKILAIYEALKDEPKVAWKDSLADVLGLGPAGTP